MSTANKIRLVQTVLAASVAAFAISVVVAGHWWTTPPPPPPPPPSVNVAELKARVVGLLRDRLNTDDAFKEYGITVADDLTLINTDLNKYDGLATVHTRKGTQKFLEVIVEADPHRRDDVPDGPRVGVKPDRDSQQRTEAERLAAPQRRRQHPVEAAQ